MIESALRDRLAGYSCPTVPFDRDFHTALIVEHAGEVVRRLVHAPGVEPDVRRVLHNFRECVTPETGWHISLGRAFEALSRLSGGPPDPLAVAGLALHSSASGAVGRWAMSLPRPHRFRWSDYLLPPASRLTVESSVGRAVVESRHELARTSTEFVRKNGRWQTSSELVRPLAASRWGESELLLLHSEAIDDTDFDRRMTVQSVSTETERTFDAAFQMVQRCGTRYVAWVTRAVQGIDVLAGDGLKMDSGSQASHHGMVQITDHPNPLAISEMLIHESSHQYYYMAERLGPVDDGSDETLYYSPAKRTKRPTSQILLAFHAFANVLLFYRACARWMPNDPFLLRSVTDLVHQVEQLRQPLVDNPALTSVGRSLVDPLIDALE